MLFNLLVQSNSLVASVQPLFCIVKYSVVPVPRKAHSPSSEQLSFITTRLIQYRSWCYNWIWLYVLVVFCTYQFVLWNWCTQGQLYVYVYIFPVITLSHWTVLIRITFIFYHYWYVGMLHNRLYSIFVSFSHSLVRLDMNLSVLPFSSIWKCWICLVIEGWAECEYPVPYVTSRVAYCWKCCGTCVFWMNTVRLLCLLDRASLW